MVVPWRQGCCLLVKNVASKEKWNNVSSWIFVASQACLAKICLFFFCIEPFGLFLPWWLLVKNVASKEKWNNVSISMSCCFAMCTGAAVLVAKLGSVSGRMPLIYCSQESGKIMQPSMTLVFFPLIETKNVISRNRFIFRCALEIEFWPPLLKQRTWYFAFVRWLRLCLVPNSSKLSITSKY